MKLLKIIILLIFFAFAIALKTSFAAVESSPHDMISQEYFTKEETVKRTNCSYCHLNFKEPGNKIWKEHPPSLKGFGEVGPACYSCHDGVTIVDINVDASRTAFSVKSHGLSIEKLPKGDSMQNVTLKYAKEKFMECTTCHPPHNNENRPFLAEPLKELCNICHQSRRNSGFGINNFEGNHPVGVNPSDVTGGPSPINLSAIFNTKFPRPYPIAGGKFSEGVHWDLGGHLTNGKMGNIECYTCHAVHGDEISGPNDKLMTVNPVRKINDAFCEGCHKGARGDKIESNAVFPNPGGTKEARTYHPADDDVSNGSGRIVNIKEPPDWPFGNGEPKAVICSTCHDVHNAMSKSPILRTTTKDAFCEECHDEKIQGHHTSGSDSNPRNVKFATTGYKWSYEDATAWENGNPKIKLEADTNSNGYGNAYGKNIENKIYCSSCHKAHNAGNGIEKKATPSLVISHTANQLCFLCHLPANVAFNTNQEMTASHFIGDPTRADTYGKPKDKLHLYRGEWPETGIKSKFGGDNQYEVICESCHSFNKNNLNSVAYGYIKNKEMLIARADDKFEWSDGKESGKSEEIEDDSDIEFDDEENAGATGVVGESLVYYLCAGCHSSDPGSDESAGESKEKDSHRSHPMMGVDGTLINGLKIIRVAIPPATYTKNLKMNCDSCHFVHNAKVQGGCYILKEVQKLQVENTNPLAIHPEADYTTLCALCHQEQ